MTDFANVYEDEVRASAYADLEFPGTYYLAFRDIPMLLEQHARGRRALDFGCGAGRSTRFLRELGYDAMGCDIADAMLREAAARDPDGTYIRVGEGDLGALGAEQYDVILATFTFDNIPGRELRARTMRQLAQRLTATGIFINLVSSPEIYWHEWASFSTSEFPENRQAGSGDVVRIVMLDVPDRRPVEDVVWTETDYRALYAEAGMRVRDLHRPLGRADEGRAWKAETSVPPWTLYVLEREA